MGTTVLYGPRGTVTVRDRDGSIADHVNSLVGRSVENEASNRDILNALNELGLIAESWNAWQQQYLLESNPQPLLGRLRPDELTSYTTDRRPARSTTSYDSPVATILRSRQSCRSFDNGALDDSIVQSLLDTVWNPSRGGSASAGALYPTSVSYICIDFRHQMVRHIRCDRSTGTWMEQAESPTIHELTYALNSDNLIHGAPVVAVVWADVTASAMKYSNRALRFSLLETGHIGQNIQLLAVERGWSTLEWGAFKDQPLAELLDHEHASIPVTCIGIGSGSKFPPHDPFLRSVLQPTEVRDPEFQGRSAGIVIAQRRSGAVVQGTGVGWTTKMASTRCVGESIERAGLSKVQWDRACRAADLDGHFVIPSSLYPANLELFDELGYSPFSHKNVYKWVKGWRGSNEQLVYAPIDILYSSPDESQSIRCGRATSSGVAFHTSKDAAADAALMELIERDAFVRAWLSQVPPRRVTSPDLPGRERIRKVGRLISMQFDAAIPTIGVAILADRWPALSFGLASARSIEHAHEKAYLDAYASFLVASESPIGMYEADINTPLGRALYYMDPNNLASIEWFFLGGRDATPYNGQHIDDLREATSNFVLSTPVEGYVVRAINDALLPIWFRESCAPLEAKGRVPHFFS